ncbi:hypothetical protein IFM89_038749 [Coptis chinensis]|uniref:Cytochrome P450 n=1 Tax=Coptis chinensis TaxID=261450 RepID=A0A835LQ67_9MAGN|nr:hypothetical protein IFM89_038749 [Coptis chinensis]
MIGQSLSLLRAMKANTAEKWIEERASKYGPISKLTLFGLPTVFIHGQAANKFMFTSDTLNNQQPQSISTLLGKRNLLELSGEDHKRVRGAIMTFLKPEVLKQYVGKMDGERLALEKQPVSPNQDLITSLLSIRGEDNASLLSEKEIVDNVMLVMTAGHDTSSVLITFIVQLLGNNPNVYAIVTSEHEEIAKSKTSRELLTWEDLTKMKYTWRVALKILRISLLYLVALERP